MRLGFWRKCRTVWRWCRRALLIAALVAIVAVLWFNRIGLPGFLTTRLVGELQSHGLKLEYSRMRLSLVRGLVADNVRIGHAKADGSPSLSLVQIQLQLDFHALLRRQLQVDGLVLREGKLILPLSPTNELVLDNIQTDLRFQTNNTWSLDNFHAEFAGAKLNLSGEVAHAPEITGWQIFQGGKSTNHAPESPQLRKFLDALARIHFDASPELNLAVNGDARDIRSFKVRLAITQGQTRLELGGRADGTNGSCLWRIHGALDPKIARPILASINATHGLDILTFRRPVFLDARGRGRLDDADSISAAGRVALTNFMVRGESFGDVESAFDYRSRVLEFLNPQMHTGPQKMTADSVTLDFNSMLLHFTNGFGNGDPDSVARAIGPKTGRIVAPYHFLKPPVARVNGQIPLRDMHGGSEMDEVNMRFDVIGDAPFQWMKFRTTNVTGTIFWRAQTLVVTNVVGEFYGGRANGFASFNFQVPHEGADYNFLINMNDVNLHSLASDLSSPTNTLEGALSGLLVVTGADTRDMKTWNGFGRANLTDGLIWEIPFFGIVSQGLNKVKPGLGNSRATDASANFTVTNGLFYTDPLEIHSTMTRLQYVGTMDMDQNVNAIVTAQLLRDTPVIGSAVSFIFTPFTKLFEYKISGTLKNPKSELANLPNFLMMPFHPIRSLEGMFPYDAFTNAPAGN